MSRSVKAQITVQVPKDQRDNEILKQVKLDLDAAGFGAPIDEFHLSATVQLKYEVEYEFDT